MKHADINELRAAGVIQEVNRQLLHPVGLALEVTIESPEEDANFGPEWQQIKQVLDELNGGEVEDFVVTAVYRALFPAGSARLSGVWDCRDDPEGIYYDETDLRPLAKRFREDANKRKETRRARLGYVVQPAEGV